jgi:nitric oxide dioxygenase
MPETHARAGSELAPSDIALVRRTLAQLDANADDVVTRFYDLLFDQAPALRPLFARNTAEAQAQMFRETLYLIVDHLDDAPWVARTLARLGERHAGYGVTAEMYAPVGDAVLATLAQSLGPDWTADVERAWERAYARIRDLMLVNG